MNLLLSAKNIHKRFGGVHALNDACVDIVAGEVHALIGENGAGKSTIGKIIAGVHQPDSGTIFFKGDSVTLPNPLAAQRLGIGIIFQELDLFPNLTIGENIVINNLHFAEGITTSNKKIENFCRPFLEQVNLDLPASRMVKNLSMGQMQLVAIARVLSMNAKIIVMDESTSSLTEDAVDNLFTIIDKLKASGVAIIYVSHKMDEIFKIADRATVFRDGCYIGTNEISETTSDELIQMMVGRKVEGKERSTSHKKNELLLLAKNLTTQKLCDVSFELNKGEVLGIAGLVGAGRSELGNALFGMDPVLNGEIQLNGKNYSPSRPRHAIRSGLGLVPEDRKLEGLMLQMSVKENASLSTLDGSSSAGWISKSTEFDRYQKIAKETRLKAGSPDHAISTLSGGNQQKVLLGRWLMVNPDVLFLDDPTRGVDVGAKEDIYSLIEEQAKQGKGIILVSSELPELLRCCDRIMVMHEGHITGTLDADAATQEAIMKLATAQLN